MPPVSVSVADEAGRKLIAPAARGSQTSRWVEQPGGLPSRGALYRKRQPV